MVLCEIDFAADRPLDGCPLGTYGFGKNDCGSIDWMQWMDDKCDAPNTCFCEDHCSWKRCKMDKPPQRCLDHAKREWVYDKELKYWRTNLIGKFDPIFLTEFSKPFI